MHGTQEHLHAARFRTYLDYVESHGLHHVFLPGEDPNAFERRIATVRFPEVVRVRRHAWVARTRKQARRRIRGLAKRVRDTVATTGGRR